MVDSIAKHAGVVEVDNAAASLTDYSGEVKTASVKRTLNSTSYHVLGSDDEKTTQGGRVQELMIEGEISKNPASLYNVLRLAYETPIDKTIAISNPDDATGSLSISGEWRLTGLDPYVDLNSGSGDPQTFKATFKPNGAVTTAIIA